MAPIPASAAVVTQARMVERAYSAAAVAGYGAFKAPESLSESNGAPINKTEQVQAVKGMLMATVVSPVFPSPRCLLAQGLFCPGIR